MRQLPPLNALQVFETAARYLSFQRAAEELNVTPTAVSHQIKVLEDHLGLSLFQRRPRPLSFTEAGRILYPLVQESFDIIDTALIHLKHLPDSLDLTISVPPVFAAKWLVPRLSSFQQAYPDVSLRLRAANTLLDLRSRTTDLAIRYEQGDYPGVVVHPLMSDVFRPVCSPHLLDGRCPLKEPNDLAEYPLLHLECGHCYQEVPNWQNWLTSAGGTLVDPTRGVKFDEETLAIQAAILGQGVALCSSIHAANDVTSGYLVQPLETALDGFIYSAVYLEDHPKEKVILKFVEWLKLSCEQGL